MLSQQSVSRGRQVMLTWGWNASRRWPFARVFIEEAADAAAFGQRSQKSGSNLATIRHGHRNTVIVLLLRQWRLCKNNNWLLNTFPNSKDINKQWNQVTGLDIKSVSYYWNVRPKRGEKLRCSDESSISLLPDFNERSAASVMRGSTSRHSPMPLNTLLI